MADKYSTFAALQLSEPASAYRITVRDMGSQVAVVAPHGGGIEPGTTEVSLAIARDDLSLYLFEGIKKQANADLHVTSTRFDEPRCIQLLKGVNLVVAVHGEGGAGEVVYLGGRHVECCARIKRELESRGFRVERHASPRLQGSHLNNICNRCASSQGVQLELSAGLRKTFFASLGSANGRTQTTGRFGDFSEAVRAALASLELA